MEALTIHRGKVMPLDRVNVDTDAIIPAEYLKSVTRTGYADGLFTNWRYRSGTREPNPDFVLNMLRYQGATILLARENFGCGSSREHAPWALYEYGFRVIIAPSFGDIFYNNCFSVGILPVCLAPDTIQYFFEEIEKAAGYILTVDLPAQVITTPAQKAFSFEIAPFRKEALVQGLDAIDRTLQFQDDIATFEAQRSVSTPWYELEVGDLLSDKAIS
jgi:3-isopropylmalate/(R)-2-methylmalate dehydratase small subunit